MLTINSTLDISTKALTAHSTSPRLDSEILLSHVLKIERTSLLTHPERKITTAQI